MISGFLTRSRLSYQNLRPMNLGKPLYNFALATTSDKAVILTGGYNGSIILDQAHSYNVTGTSIGELPKLNVARESHSSCVAGSHVYVFCGYNQAAILNSIEWLGVEHDQKGELSSFDSQWGIQKVEDLRPRLAPVVSSLGQDSLLIYGGEVDTYSLIGNGLVWDTKQKKVTKNFDKRQWPCKSFCAGEQTHDEKVLAIVIAGTIEGSSQLVEIDTKSPDLSVVKNYGRNEEDFKYFKARATRRVKRHDKKHHFDGKKLQNTEIDCAQCSVRELVQLENGNEYEG